MTLDAIKAAIAELPASEKVTLIRWLAAGESDSWDRQIEADFSNGGSGMALLDQWDAEIEAGESVSVEEFLTTRQKTR